VSGIALANAGLGAVHGFAAALGGATELPHGLICAVFLAPVLRANADAVRADLLPLCLDAGMGPGRDPVAWLAGEVQGLLGAFGMPRRLARGPGGIGGAGFSAAALAAVAEASSGSSMSGNPVSLEIPARLAILREALVT
jgi:alcohol dehydrogenase class IV